MGVLFFQKVWVKMFWLGMKVGLLSKKLDWGGGEFRQFWEGGYFGNGPLFSFTFEINFPLNNW